MYGVKFVWLIKALSISSSDCDIARHWHSYYRIETCNKCKWSSL